jgi:hypothetical protein
VLEPRACPKDQIRGSLVTVLVLRWSEWQEMQLSFPLGVLSCREGLLILPAVARYSTQPSQGMLA